jgi:hypothetical protein
LCLEIGLEFKLDIFLLQNFLQILKKRESLLIVVEIFIVSFIEIGTISNGLSVGENVVLR